MIPTIKVTQTFDNVAAIRRAVQALTEQDVFIGIPEDETARKEADATGISNAYLGYIHEHGVPEKNIPARPHLIPGILDIQEEAAELLKQAAKKALEGKEGAVNTALNKIGLLGQKAVKARFVNNDWEPLSEKTLNRTALIRDSEGNEQFYKSGDKKGQKKRTQSRAGKKRVNPLIDTSQLRKAYTYVIRKKGNSALIVK